MKSKKRKKYKSNYLLCSLAFIVVVIVIYVLIYICFLGDGIFLAGKNLQKKDWLSFLCGYLSFVGTGAVSLLAVLQGHTYNKQENERRISERYNSIQPIFSIEITRNLQVPGTAEILNLDEPIPKHDNVMYTIENVGQYPVTHLIVFDKYIKNVFKPGDKISIMCAYHDSIDAKKWPNNVLVLTDEYEREGNLPKWFNICYEDIDGNAMFQMFKVKDFDDKVYYSLDSREMVERSERQNGSPNPT